MPTHSFSGAITAIITPFTADDAVDYNAFKRIVEAQKKAGISGIIVSGTTGESPTITSDEKLELVKVALDYQADDFKVFVGTGTNNTNATIEASKFYADFKDDKGRGVNGLLIVVPYYNKPNQDSMFAHFNAVAKAVPNTEVCVYNVPGRTVASLSPETFLYIAQENENITAIKDAVGDVCETTKIRNLLNEHLPTRNVQILSGDDMTFAPALLCGADGVISVASHITPEVFVRMIKAKKENDLATIGELHQKSLSFFQSLFLAPNPVPLKHLLAHMGYCESHVRLPLIPLNNESNLPKDLIRGLEHIKALEVPTIP